jgi:hypothetical protein
LLYIAEFEDQMKNNCENNIELKTKTEKKMTKKNIYITMLGRSIWAVLNSYYAVLKEKQYYPDDIFLFAETISDPEHARNLEITKQGLTLTSSHFGISPAIHHQIISEVECEVESNDDFIKAVQCVSSLIKERKKAGDTVALDITPGKRTLVTGALCSPSLSRMWTMYSIYRSRTLQQHLS